MNVAGMLRQKRYATAGTRFTKPGAHFLALHIDILNPHAPPAPCSASSPAPPRTPSASCPVVAEPVVKIFALLQVFYVVYFVFFKSTKHSIDG